MELFEPHKIGQCTLPNRVIRSATFEGMCDGNGNPLPEYYAFYEKLADQQIGALITGFMYISEQGRAMQPGQAGLDSAEKIPHFRKMTQRVHRGGGSVFAQLAHSGRQSRSNITGQPLVSSSTKKSSYFREKPTRLQNNEIRDIACQFADSAAYAKDAGFDGIQIHAAHGYLVHQFIHPEINDRKDEYGPDKEEIGKKLLQQVVEEVGASCGDNFPVLVKISASDNLRRSFSEKQFIHLIKFLDTLNIDAIEISYGTMDYPLNIFRGDFPEDLILTHNPFFRNLPAWKKFLIRSFYFPYHKSKLEKFKPTYNQHFAVLAKKFTTKPIISVGGFRTKTEIQQAISKKGIDMVALCRPFLAEPDLVNKMKQNTTYSSKCTNCNYCAIMCDTIRPTRCYKN